jgi:hypothetical protein
MKHRRHYKRAIKRHYGGELRGLTHAQLVRQRGFRGTTLGPANRGHRLDAAEHQAIEQKMRDEGPVVNCDLMSAAGIACRAFNQVSNCPQDGMPLTENRCELHH